VILVEPPHHVAEVQLDRGPTAVKQHQRLSGTAHLVVNGQAVDVHVPTVQLRSHDIYDADRTANGSHDDCGLNRAHMATAALARQRLQFVAIIRQVGDPLHPPHRRYPAVRGTPIVSRSVHRRFDNRQAQIAGAVFGAVISVIGLGGIAEGRVEGSIYLLSGLYTAVRSLHSSCVVVGGSGVSTRSIVRTRRYAFQTWAESRWRWAARGSPDSAREYLVVHRTDGQVTAFKELNCRPPEEQRRSVRGTACRRVRQRARVAALIADVVQPWRCRRPGRMRLVLTRRPPLRGRRAGTHRHVRAAGELRWRVQEFSRHGCEPMRGPFKEW
jgi:hypothetical protein